MERLEDDFDFIAGEEEEDLPEEFKFISHYHSIASTYMEMEWICANDTDRRTPEEMARTITEARRISMSDTYFGPNNRIYELRITGRIGITIKKEERLPELLKR